MIGQSVPRKEDERLVSGRGLYVDDVRVPGMLHLAFVRSTHAHAGIRAVHRERALALPGVVAVVTAEDWPELSRFMPELMEPGTLINPYCDFNRAPPRVLFSPVVKYVGEQIAIVVAETGYAAADACEAIEVEYEPLPVIATWDQALAPGAARVHQDYENVVAHLAHEIGDVDGAFAAAEIVAEERLELQSVRSMAIECRAAAAQWDAATGTLNVWSTSQLYYMVRDSVAQILGLAYDRVRVIARDVGGGFGLKGVLHPEDIIVPIVAYKLQRPVRWAETRSEHMIASNQSGTQVHDVRVAARRDGTILALDVKIYKEVGAYNHFEMVVPTNTVNHLPLQYRIPNLRAEAWSITTHKTPVSPYRGAGRPEATFTTDRALDLVARKAGLDPLEVRLRNIIPAEAMPYETGLTYRDGVRVRYDGADFPRMLRKAVECADYHGWRARQVEARRQGRAIGIGVSSYMEAGGIGPCEGATIQIEDTGRVSVFIGVNSQGQSHETTFAQICAQHLGARYEDVVVSGGDTALIRTGFGTGASRVAVNTGNAVFKSAVEVKRKVVRLAAHLFECGESDIEVKDGVASVISAPEMKFSFAELAATAHRHRLMAELGGPGLAATEYFYPRTVTWSNGFHIAVVELDRETGRIRILKYAVTHDCGVPLNPMIVDGQIRGGFAQGLGMALGEEVIYDGEAQVLSGSMMDYLVPRASDMPELDVEHFVFPTDENPLGIRAVGESGPISPPAALAAAVEDAIGGGVRITRLPLSPRYILGLLENARR
jgi:carbon-monoxide dehydrogenase large subunit